VLQLQTPRRGADGGFDGHLQSQSQRNPFTSGGDTSFGGLGDRPGSALTFGTTSVGAGGGAAPSSATKAFAPRSLLDAGKAARAAQEAALQQQQQQQQQQAAAAAAQAASHLSPAQQQARVLRSSSVFAGGPSGGIPSQSLRDFLPAQPTRNVLSTPAATPFASEVSPIRPAAFTPAAKKGDEEQKEAAVEPANASLFATPLGMPTASTWLATPGATALSSQLAAQPAQPLGLGFSARSDPCSVTVFGFQPHDAARVLARFHALGEVVEREDGAMDRLSGSASGAAAPAPSANWVHLRYSTPTAAAMALAQNGRVICDGALMIGVKPRVVAIDEACDGVVGLSQRPARHQHGSIFERGVRKQQQGQGQTAANGTSAGALTASSIYASAQASHPSALRKSACTKFFEYLFNF